MVFNATFNNISIIVWQTTTGSPGEIENRKMNQSLYGTHHHIYHIGVTENKKMNQSLYGTHHHTYHIEVTENRKMNQSLYGTHHHIEVYIT
jgi:hypothetical protein